MSDFLFMSNETAANKSLLGNTSEKSDEDAKNSTGKNLTLITNYQKYRVSDEQLIIFA